jgi:hypothetical protein
MTLGGFEGVRKQERTCAEARLRDRSQLESKPKLSSIRPRLLAGYSFANSLL